MNFMTNLNQHFFGPAFAAVALTVAIFVSGCSSSAQPDVTAGGGIVTINGAPLNNVELRFIPMQDGLDGNFIAKGVSDENGKFVLMLPGNSESGVCVGKNRVIVLEGPMPDDARDMSEESQRIAINFNRSLKNRPIPRRYSSLSETDLTIDVVEGTTEYNIDLTR